MSLITGLRKQVNAVDRHAGEAWRMYNGLKAVSYEQLVVRDGYEVFESNEAFNRVGGGGNSGGGGAGRNISGGRGAVDTATEPDSALPPNFPQTNAERIPLSRKGGGGYSGGGGAGRTFEEDTSIGGPAALLRPVEGDDEYDQYAAADPEESELRGETDEGLDDIIEELDDPYTAEDDGDDVADYDDTGVDSETGLGSPVGEAFDSFFRSDFHSLTKGIRNIYR
jgi:hypothetical protein